MKYLTFTSDEDELEVRLNAYAQAGWTLHSFRTAFPWGSGGCSGTLKATVVMYKLDNAVEEAQDEKAEAMPMKG